MNDKSLSEYVKLMRKEHNLTQVELSENQELGCALCANLSRENKLCVLIK